MSFYIAHCTRKMGCFKKRIIHVTLVVLKRTIRISCAFKSCLSHSVHTSNLSLISFWAIYLSLFILSFHKSCHPFSLTFLLIYIVKLTHKMGKFFANSFMLRNTFLFSWWQKVGGIKLFPLCKYTARRPISKW